MSRAYLVPIVYSRLTVPVYFLCGCGVEADSILVARNVQQAYCCNSCGAAAIKTAEPSGVGYGRTVVRESGR